MYFFAGEGPQPSSKGFIVPDELGYLAPLGIYRNQDVIIQLPGDKTIFEVDWLALYNTETKERLRRAQVVALVLPQGGRARRPGWSTSGAATTHVAAQSSGGSPPTA